MVQFIENNIKKGRRGEKEPEKNNRPNTEDKGKRKDRDNNEQQTKARGKKKSRNFVIK